MDAEDQAQILVTRTPVDIPQGTREKLYRPLAPWQTRILRVHPSVETQLGLLLELLTADLIAFPGIGIVAEKTMVEYEALSYSWGYPALKETVLCNSTPMSVSETALDALRHLRKAGAVRYL
jgi:Heterokaryon incompatibility protein (HET)